MWLTKTYNEKFQQEYKIESKLLETKGNKHNIEIFNAQAFGGIALIDETIMFKDFVTLQSEFLAHTAVCSHKEPKKVLVLGSFNLEIAYELLRHLEIKVDFLQFDLKVLQSLISFLPHYQEVLDNPRFTHIPQLENEFIQQNQERNNPYDIILCLESKKNYESYYNLLSEDGIMIIKCPHLLLDTKEAIKTLESLDDSFKVKMPFYMPLFFDMNDCYIFASKKYHPIADIMLQRADMLEDLQYYHANLHLSAFTLPKAIKKSLLGVAKN